MDKSQGNNVFCGVMDCVNVENESHRTVKSEHISLVGLYFAFSSYFEGVYSLSDTI